MKGLANPSRLALFAVVLAIGGGLVGAGLFSLLGPSKTTVIRTAAVPAIPVSNAPTIPVGKIYQADGPGVVDIVAQGVTNTEPSNAPGGGGGGGTVTAEGAGFIYDSQGHIVTNDHVVSGASSIKVKFSDNPKETYNAKIVGTDPTTDLAVLEVNAPSSLLHPLTLGNSSDLYVGAGVVAIGSPFGLPETVTSGIISALGREIQSPFNNATISNVIQTDAPINQGNSGGPLLNMQGQVIGINAQIATDSGDNSGVGFAIPINTIQRVANQLIKTGKAEHAYLGVLVPGTGTLTIQSIESNSPAAKAGLTKGEVITAVNGTRVNSFTSLSAVLSTLKPGDTVSVAVSSNGKSKTVRVTLGNEPST